MKIGAAVRTLREERGWTLEQLAELAHSSKSNLSNLENDRQGYSPARLKAVADAFGVKVSALFRLAEDLEAGESVVAASPAVAVEPPAGVGEVPAPYHIPMMTPPPGKAVVELPDVLLPVVGKLAQLQADGRLDEARLQALETILTGFAGQEAPAAPPARRKAKHEGARQLADAPPAVQAVAIKALGEALLSSNGLTDAPTVRQPNTVPASAPAKKPAKHKS